MDLKKLLIVIFGSVFVLIAFAILIAYLFLFISPKGFSFGANNVALISLEGEITNENPFSLFKSKTAFDLIDELNEAEEDPSVSAILLEINSPGGSVVASKQIVEKIKSLQKPVVAWISDYGTSGAYYIAAASDYIIADSSSITGSIGVISLIPNISGLLNDFGIEMQVLKAGELKDIGSPFKKLTEKEKKIFEEIISQIFNEFKADIISLRKDKLNIAKFEQIADGRFLTGKQALSIGLIDELGSRESALLKAASLAGIEGKPSIKDFSKNKFSFAELFSQAGFFFASGFKIGLQKMNYSDSVIEIK